MLRFPRRSALALLLAASLARPALAGDAVILTVAGPDGAVELTRAEIEALPQHALTTSTTFTDGTSTFRGPRATDVLALVGVAAAREVALTAANDYAVTIPFDDLVAYQPVLATHLDGVELGLRDRGPLWLMYPLDDHAALRSPLYTDRLIWQVVRMEAR